MFHFKDGLCFKRLEDGSVQILKFADTSMVFGNGDPETSYTIDPHSWMSVLDAVGYNPGQTIEIANLLHRGIGSQV